MLTDATGVRERLWLLAHDDAYPTDIRTQIDVRALGIGLVAAALADLLAHNLIQIRGGMIYPLAGGMEPTSDLIAAGILAAIREDGASRLTDVLRGARADISGVRLNPYVGVYQRTRAALVATGVLIEHRRTLRPTRYRLADRHTIARHRNHFNSRLVRQHIDSDSGTDCLCAFVWALNIHRALLMPYPPGEADAILLDITERIPARAGPQHPLTVVPQLARSVRYAVGDLATAAF